MSDGENIRIADLGYANAGKSHTPEGIFKAFTADFNLDFELEMLTKEYLSRALEQTRGNKTQAAKLLGLASYQRLDAMLKKLKIEDFRP